MRPSSSIPSTLLYVIVFLAWSGAWFAMKQQTGTVSPLVSVALRFLLAASLVFLIAWLKGERLRFSLGEHMKVAVIGATLFSTNFIFAYYATLHLTSALISAILSLSAAFNLLISLAVYGKRPAMREVVGATTGSIGLSLLLWPEISQASPGESPIAGVILALGMVICFSIGSMVSAKLQKSGFRTVPTSAWAMAWGGFLSTVMALAAGQSWHIDISASYLGSLAFLVGFGTVTAFLSYITLIARVGAFRAASLNLMVPAGAFTVSTWLEGFNWSAISLVGLMIATIGNYLMLAQPRRHDGPLNAVKEIDEKIEKGAGARRQVAGR